MFFYYVEKRSLLNVLTLWLNFPTQLCTRCVLDVTQSCEKSQRTNRDRGLISQHQPRCLTPSKFLQQEQQPLRPSTKTKAKCVICFTLCLFITFCSHWLPRWLALSYTSILSLHFVMKSFVESSYTDDRSLNKTRRDPDVSTRRHFCCIGGMDVLGWS